MRTSEQRASYVAKKLWAVTQINPMWTSEDLQQEAQLAEWQAILAGKAVNAEVLKNRVIDAIRQTSPGCRGKLVPQMVEFFDNLQAEFATSESQIEARDFLNKLHHCLTEVEQHAAYLFFVQELPATQVAKKLNLTLYVTSTVLLKVQAKAERLRYGRPKIQASGKQRGISLPGGKSRKIRSAARA